MYNPKPFHVGDTDKLVKFASKHDFGHLFCSANGEFSVASIPMLVNENFTRIRGHLAMANGIWKGNEGKNVLVLFPGPNHYISPVWYEEEQTVPTWNYVNITASGIFRIIDDEQKKMEILDDLTLLHETQLGGNWSADWNESKLSGMLKAIVAFEIEVTKVEGKWKMSQNHLREKCFNVIGNLRSIGTPESLEMADLMESVWL